MKCFIGLALLGLCSVANAVTCEKGYCKVKTKVQTCTGWWWWKTCTDKIEEKCRPCSVNGGWTKFYIRDRTECSVTCGGGGFRNLTRERKCSNPAPVHGGKDCQGPAIKFDWKPCGEKPCPVDGAWTHWVASQTECCVTCGRGFTYVIKKRTCTNPAPLQGGKNCKGKDVQRKRERCNTPKCP